MKTLDRAIYYEWLRGFSVSLGLLVLTLFLVQSSRISSLLFSLSPDAATFFHTLLLLLPSYLVLCIPMAHMFSCLTLALRYRRDGEVAAMQTMGLGTMRILKPLLIVAVILGGASAFLSLYVEPQAKDGVNRLVLHMASGAVQSRIVEGEIVQLTPDLALYVAGRDGDKLGNVFLAQNGDAYGERVLWAKSATIEKTDAAVVLKLRNGGLAEHGLNVLKGSFAGFDMRLPLLSAEGGAQVFPPMQCASSLNLLSAMNEHDRAFELWRRMAAPAAALFAGAAALLAAFLLPASLSYLAWLFSLLLLTAYYLSGRLGEIMAADETVSPSTAALAPLFIMAAVTLTLLGLALRRRAP